MTGGFGANREVAEGQKVSYVGIISSRIKIVLVLRTFDLILGVASLKPRISVFIISEVSAGSLGRVDRMPPLPKV